MKEESLIVSRQYLADILQVKISTLRKIESQGDLERRLKDKGYKLIDKHKKGRSFEYILEKQSSDKELLNNIAVNMFNTRNDYELGDYILYRLYNMSKPITKKMLGEWCGVNKKTISRWDDYMIKNNFMTKDGYFYIAVDYNENRKPTYRITVKDEYISYIKSSKYSKKKREIAEKYKRNELSYDEMELAIEGINEHAKLVEKKFVYRVNKFQLVKNNYLFAELVTLIESTRVDNKTYYKDWVPLNVY